MLKKKTSIILIALLTLLLIALVIWFFNKKIENMDKAYTGSLGLQLHFNPVLREDLK